MPCHNNLSIAYSMKKKQKKDSGGAVESGDKTMNYADGGEVPCPTCGSVKMSEGGMVANKTDLDFKYDTPNEFDDLALRDHLAFKYTGKNSGDEKGGPSKDDLVARA